MEKEKINSYIEKEQMIFVIEKMDLSNDLKIFIKDNIINKALEELRRKDINENEIIKNTIEILEKPFISKNANLPDLNQSVIANYTLPSSNHSSNKSMNDYLIDSIGAAINKSINNDINNKININNRINSYREEYYNDCK